MAETTPEYPFNQALFIEQYPEFAVQSVQSSLPGYWTIANSYVDNLDSFLLNGADLQLALNLMTAHIAKVFQLIGLGKTSVIVTGASEGTVSLTAAPPPALDGWKWWLGTTEYGKMLWALLDAKASGGAYVGGRPERSAFRKVFGGFW